MDIQHYLIREITLPETNSKFAPENRPFAPKSSSNPLVFRGFCCWFQGDHKVNLPHNAVDGSEIRRSPPGMYHQPMVNNGINCQPQLVNAGFVFHEQY